MSSPVATFGQDTFSSIALTCARSSSAPTSSPISSAVDPMTFVISGTGSRARAGRSSSRYARSPRFGNPIELISPAADSHSRGGGLPSRGARVIVFETYAENGNSSNSRSPNTRAPASASKQPEALITR